LNFRRANANAAGTLISSFPAVIRTEIPKLFQNQFATGKTLNASGKLDSVGWSGIS